MEVIAYMDKDCLFGQDVLFNTLKNAVDKNKLSHAYLISINNNPNYDKIINESLKIILCSNKGKDHCSICHRIDDGNYVEIKKIYPDGLYIKKEQLSELKREFNNKVIEGKYKIYIIYEADKLNLQSANSMLKFLEEPEENIIAFLLTNNVNRMLKTIVSRCQIITLNNENNYFSNDTIKNYTNLFSDLDFSTDDKKNEIDQVVNFIKYLEKEKIFTITKEKSLWLDYFKDRDTFIRGLILSLYFYRDCLRTKNINDHNLFFYDYLNVLNEISSNNDYDSLYKKVSLLIEYNNWIKGNMNTNLLIDLFIIEFGGDL